MCGRYVTPEEAAMERYWHNFVAYRISTDVGSARNQGAQLIEPL